MPSEMAAHKSSSAKGDRSVNSKESQYIFLAAKIFIPVGTRELCIIICKCSQKIAKPAN